MAVQNWLKSADGYKKKISFFGSGLTIFEHSAPAPPQSLLGLISKILLKLRSPSLRSLFCRSDAAHSRGTAVEYLTYTAS